MATKHEDRHLFPGLSITGYQTLSGIGNIDQNWSGHSLTAAFNPLRTLSPTESDAATIARYVATLTMDLLKPRS